MMRIADLLDLNDDIQLLAPTSGVNPLIEVDALQEAQLLDLRLDMKLGVVALIFELRQALQLDEGNTGVLIARGVRAVRWDCPHRQTALTAWTVGSSIPRVDDGLFTLTLDLWPSPGAQLVVTAVNAAFVVCDVQGLSDAPPDYTNLPPRSLTHEIAHWQSEFSAVSVAVASLSL